DDLDADALAFFGFDFVAIDILVLHAAEYGCAKGNRLRLVGDVLVFRDFRDDGEWRYIEQANVADAALGDDAKSVFAQAGIGGDLDLRLKAILLLFFRWLQLDDIEAGRVEEKFARVGEIVPFYLQF